MTPKRFKRVAAGVFVAALIIVGAVLLRNRSAGGPPSEGSVETPKTLSAEGDNMRTPSKGSAAQKHGHEHEIETGYHTANSSGKTDDEEIVVPDLIRERPLDTTGDIGVFHQAHLAVKDALAKVKEGNMGLSDVYALIEGYDLNSDWRLFLRLYAKKHLGLPLTSREFWYVAHAPKALRPLFRAQWKSEMEEMRRRLRPIHDTKLWAKINAPIEYKHLDTYPRLAQGPPPLPEVERYMDLDARVDYFYDAFYRTLEGLPPDSKVYEALMENLAKGASASPARVESSQVAPPAVETPAPPATEVEPVQRESSPRPAPEPPPALEPGPPAPPDAPHRPPAADAVEFEAAVSAAIERYGVQEGMLRLAESHPEWRLRLFEWLRARQKGLTPQHGNESE